MPNTACDSKICSGCLACVVACIDQHYEENITDAVSPRIHEKWTSPHSDLVRYHTKSCRHCPDAPCVSICPTGALVIDDQGFVLTLREECTGCRACADACPHDIPRFDGEGKLVKCDGCATLVSQGLKPVCVKICNTGALYME